MFHVKHLRVPFAGKILHPNAGKNFTLARVVRDVHPCPGDPCDRRCQLNRGKHSLSTPAIPRGCGDLNSKEIVEEHGTFYFFQDTETLILSSRSLRAAQQS